MKHELAATKANLLTIREALSLAEEGHELLSQKREVLIRELVGMGNDVKKVREEADAALLEAYACLRRVLSQFGADGARRLAEGKVHPTKVEIRERSVMGVPLPLVLVNLPEKQPLWGLGELPTQIDAMVEQFRSALSVLSKQAAVESTLWRLAMELRKTQKRTNTLEYVVIPANRETVKFIQDTIEERERESHFQLKRSKASRGE